MAKFVFIAFFALVALQASLISARFIESPTTEASFWDTLASNARNALDDLKKTTGLKDSDGDKVIAKIDSDGKAVAEKVDDFINNLKVDVDEKKPEVSDFFQSVRDGLSKASEKLKTLVPNDAANKGKEIKESFNNALNDALSRVDNAIKHIKTDASHAKEGIEAKGKAILDSIVDGAKSVESTLKHAVDKAVDKVKGTTQD